MISLDLMKSSEVRIAGDQPNSTKQVLFWSLLVLNIQISEELFQWESILLLNVLCWKSGPENPDIFQTFQKYFGFPDFSNFLDPVQALFISSEVEWW